MGPAGVINRFAIKNCLVYVSQTLTGALRDQIRDLEKNIQKFPKFDLYLDFDDRNTPKRDEISKK